MAINTDTLENVYAEYEIDPAFNNLRSVPGTNLVKGHGPTNSPDLMIVGEIPGRLENERRLPFMGPVGTNLTNLLSDIGVKPSEVYMTNTVKYWPHLPGSTKTRPVTDRELAASSAYLFREIDIIDPGIVGLCGKTAIRAIFPEMEDPLKRNGQLLDDRFVILYHPAIITHDPSQKALVKMGFVWLKNHLDRM